LEYNFDFWAGQCIFKWKFQFSFLNFITTPALCFWYNYSVYFLLTVLMATIWNRMADSVEEIMKGLCRYFDKALPVMLLYKTERQQYQEACPANVFPSAIYGAEHLLRLFGMLDCLPPDKLTIWRVSTLAYCCIKL